MQKAANSETRATEFVGASMPLGWKEKLTETGGGNRSKAICDAIAAHYGWRYDLEADARKPALKVNVVSGLAVGKVRKLVAGLGLGVVADTVECSTLAPLMVRVWNKQTGECSDKLPGKKRDSRAIVKKRQQIQTAIEKAIADE